MHQQQRQKTMDWIKNVALIVVNPIMANNDSSLITNNDHDDDDNRYDYQIYLQHFERHEQISPDIAFDKLPRMNLSDDDFHCDWISSIDWIRRDSDVENVKFENVPIIHDKSTSHDDNHHQDVLLALRICALRCLFNELGILPNHCNFDDYDGLVDKCRDDWQTFRRLYTANNTTLRINYDELELYEWWNWLTPTSVGHSPRFDTMYYLVILSEPFQKTLFKRGHWISLDRISSLLLPPNDYYELNCLSKFHNINELQLYMRLEYPRIPIQRWIPFIEFYQDGCISYLPGDQFYPNHVPIIPVAPPHFNTTITMIQRRSSTSMNRIEHQSLKYQIVFSDTKMDDHYHIPRTKIRSKL
ncbi:hypothetical protein BLA29_004402 [Euroglyphus maynei]|uniref:Uncharacterized protein n=1 Tax=Euroglyphus maynei TaxID=6958 RepID=A0A1Y3B3Z6_EURMA|nr:hypothetical protein BLA29_004402 [Euroglyphus maynei]